jgi:hypothetical protein
MPVAIRARLKLLPTLREPARLRIALAIPRARRNTGPSGRYRAAAGESRSPLAPRASQPFQDLS